MTITRFIEARYTHCRKFISGLLRARLMIGAHALALLLGLGLAGASAAFATEEAAVSIRTYEPIKVDGKLNDWVRRIKPSDWLGRLALNKGEVGDWVRAAPVYVNTTTSFVEAGAVDSNEDFSAVVYTLWDPENFYVAAVVRDDGIIAEHQQGDIWQDDTFELWLDCRHDAVTETLFQDDEYQLGVSPAGEARNESVGWVWRNPKTDEVIAQMQVGSHTIEGGYVVEASVPWKTLRGCEPKMGEPIGFNISFVDKDTDQVWTHITWSGKKHSDPTQFGHLYFVDAPIYLFPEDVLNTPTPDNAQSQEPSGESAE